MAAGNTNQKKGYAIDFIDPLFAVAIHIGFVEGIMEEKWFEPLRFPADGEWVDFAVFILGLVVLVLSWVGYHESVRLNPIKETGRFWMDVILLILYILMLVKYGELQLFTLILFFIFSVYIAWDVLKIKEYPTKYYTSDENVTGILIVKNYAQTFVSLNTESKFAREVVTFAWMLYFLALFLATFAFIHSYPQTEWMILVLLYFGIFAYRFDKNKLRICFTRTSQVIVGLVVVGLIVWLAVKSALR